MVVCGREESDGQPLGRLRALAGGGGREGGVRPPDPIILSLPLPLPPPPPSARVGRGGGEMEREPAVFGRDSTGGGSVGSCRGDLMWAGPLNVLLRPLSLDFTGDNVGIAGNVMGESEMTGKLSEPMLHVCIRE